MENYSLARPNDEWLRTLSTWFTNEQELFAWSGPFFRYPFSESTFKEDLKLDELNSYCLVDAMDRLIAFGQYYDRLGRCHLGRLAVAPEARGQGIVSLLIKILLERGMKQLDATEGSLFVLESNQAAIKAYLKLGFELCDYPLENPIDDCFYMVVSDERFHAK